MKRKWPAMLMILIPVLGFSLTFEEVIESAGLLYEDRAAVLMMREAQAAAKTAAHPGDITLSAQPEVQAITADGGVFGEGWVIDGSISVSIPIALSDEKRRLLDSAMVRVQIAEGQLPIDHAGEIFKLWSAYQNAWLAQEELAVLVLEEEAARTALAESEQLFRSGSISLTQLQQAENSLRESQTNRLEGELLKRISWLEVSYMADIDPARQLSLEPFAADVGQLPKPPALVLWALEHDGQILEQQEKIRQLSEQLADGAGAGLSSTIRTSFAAPDHGVVVSYNTLNKTLTGSYSFPVATIGEDSSASGGGSGDTWSVGLAVNLALSGGRESGLEQEMILISKEQEHERLAILEESLGLEIRSFYQKFVLGQEAVEQAMLNLAAVSEQDRLVRDLFEERRITEAELLSSGAQLARAKHLVDVAEVRLREARYAAAAAASYLNELISMGGE